MQPAVPIPLALGRFKQLPQRTAEVWQGGVVRLPAWIDDPNSRDGLPYRPTGVLWVSLRTGRVNMQIPPRGRTASADLALSGLFEFAAKEAKADGGRPARIEVRGPELKDALASALAGTGTAVVVVDELPAIRQVISELETAQTGRAYPGLLGARGMTVSRVRAFAEAAARFYEARPWTHLQNEDLVVVESANIPKSMKCLSVLGNGGQEFGLAFFNSPAAFERIVKISDPQRVQRAFGVTFGPAEDFPFADVDLWEDHGLPVSNPRAYPLAADIRRDRIERPDVRTLTSMEALLRALTDTTETDLDSGRWERRVDTFDGPITLTLRLPSVLHADRGAGDVDRKDDSRSPVARARDLVDDAVEATGRRRITLARRALSIDPDCADAFVVLGDVASTPQDALELYQRAMEAGERLIGGERVAQSSGNLWDHIDARAYMRARLAFAEALHDVGRNDEAVAHFQDLLRLNPGDDQGVRLLLLPLLLECGRDQETGALLASYEGDLHAVFPFGRALWLFVREGDTARARDALETASRVNPYVVGYLVDPDSRPPTLPAYYVLGSKQEAAYTADAMDEAFACVTGALEWLRARALRLRTPRKKRLQR